MEGLTREDFRLWLVAKEPDEYVGWGANATHCPGAEFLRELGDAMPVVHYSRLPPEYCPAWLSEFYCPAWLSEFAAALDISVGQQYWKEGRPITRQKVTAKQALAVLDAIEVEG